MILGITGKSGTGKHTAAKFFEQKGWKVLDADKIAHKLYRPYQRIWREVVDFFGERILTRDDIIDRQKLKKIVFGKGPEAEKALKNLNDIVHPELKRYLKDEIYYMRKKKANTVVVAALWKELDLFKLCDSVLLIRAGDALAYERIHKRDGIDYDMYEAATKNYKEPENAQVVIVNEGSFQDFYRELNKLPQNLT
ncbi:dephospho-CoA kinase [Patescibacteria group bacterium]|nr:dephospho-CoA kinase [Patescibacteria group bacterium]MBU1015491.1 dephospho-CoA kinase [Patescibacteria group bacterium]MBU1685414.1 dephospho-CoA kinase [Patescibacteria group bacterium]MBU1938375.1 dephospho-CoA kinase [Patescibacteria group bacterium]